MFEVITGSLRDLKMAKTMKQCELCELSARLYCESDEASLCWDCDAKVHSANFLVARHCRSLLCQICQSVTAWRASGAKPGLTVSVCERCAGGSRAKSDGDDDEGNNDENQVVPLASGYSGPPLSCSSADQEESSGDERHCAESPLSIAPPDAASHKRPHESLDLNTYEGDCGCSSSGVHNSNNNISGCEDDATSSRIRVLKKRKADQGLKDDLVKTLEVHAILNGSAMPELHTESISTMKVHIKIDFDTLGGELSYMHRIASVNTSFYLGHYMSIPQNEGFGSHVSIPQNEGFGSLALDRQRLLCYMIY